MELLKKITSSWLVVILSFIVWPVGLVFLYLKLFFDGGKLKANKVFLWILVGCCCFMVIGGFSAIGEKKTADVIDIILIVLFLGGAIFAAIKAIKMGKAYKYYKTYVEYIGVRKKVSIEELAEKTSNSIEKVTQDISKMVSYKMLDSYINEENEVVLRSDNDLADAINERITVKPTISSVECKNCGATNEYREGKENRCEFCGSMLEKKTTSVK